MLKVKIQFLQRGRNSVKPMSLLLGFTFPAHLGDSLHKVTLNPLLREWGKPAETQSCTSSWYISSCIIASDAWWSPHLTVPFFIWTQQKGSGGSTACLLPVAIKDWVETGQGEDVRMVLPALAFPPRTCKIIQAIKSSKIICGDCHFSVWTSHWLNTSISIAMVP